MEYLAGEVITRFLPEDKRKVRDTRDCGGKDGGGLKGKMVAAGSGERVVDCLNVFTAQRYLRLGYIRLAEPFE